jgi:hypothetical protein
MDSTFPYAVGTFSVEMSSASLPDKCKGFGYRCRTGRLCEWLIGRWLEGRRRWCVADLGANSVRPTPCFAVYCPPGKCIISKA